MALAFTVERCICSLTSSRQSLLQRRKIERLRRLFLLRLGDGQGNESGFLFHLILNKACVRLGNQSSFLIDLVGIRRVVLGFDSVPTTVKRGGDVVIGGKSGVLKWTILKRNHLVTLVMTKIAMLRIAILILLILTYKGFRQ